MSKVITKNLNPKTKDGLRGKTSVNQKRVRDPEGKVKTLWSLDAGSSTFGSDLKYVFGRNVAKARRDNKRVIGTPDVIVAKP